MLQYVVMSRLSNLGTHWGPSKPREVQYIIGGIKVFVQLITNLGFSLGGDFGCWYAFLSNFPKAYIRSRDQELFLEILQQKTFVIH